MQISCENTFCIYYENGKCILDSICLDELGACTNMFYVSIEESYLASQRKKLLSKFEQLFNC